MRVAMVLLPLSLLAAPGFGQVGAITGEKTPANAIAAAATACKAGTPVAVTSARRATAVTIDVPGLESLRCLAARLANDPVSALAGVERVSCDAPDRATDLRCELSVATLADGGLRYAEGSASSWVTAVLAGAAQSELDADRIAILPDRIELAGELPSEEARTDLETIAAKRGVPVRSFGLKVRAPLDPATMTVLAKGTGPAQMHVSGVSADSALVLAGDASRPFIAKTGGPLLTGKISAATRAALAKALATAHPAPSVPVATKGLGRNVTISFHQAGAANVAALLGDVLNQSAVLPPGQPDVSVFVRNVPAEPVTIALAKLLGLERQKMGSTLFYVPPGTKLRVPGAQEPRRSLTVGGATASEALSLLATLTPPPFCLPAGAPVFARVRNAQPTALAEALRVIDGSAPTDAAGCTAPPVSTVKTSTELAKLKLIATLTEGATGSAALVRREDGTAALLEAAAGRLVVTTDSVSLEIPGGRGSLTLEAQPLASEAPLLDYRLVATLVSAQGSAAILQGRRGRIRVVQTAWTEDGAVKVLPGKLEITESAYDAYGLRRDKSRELRLR